VERADFDTYLSRFNSFIYTDLDGKATDLGIPH
jgi:hypothetical protein